MNQENKNCKGKMQKCSETKHSVNKHSNWCNGCFNNCPECPKEKQENNCKCEADNFGIKHTIKDHTPSFILTCQQFLSHIKDCEKCRRDIIKNGEDY